MSVADYFKPTKTMTAEEVRLFLKNNRLSDYTLIDVRQPHEYQRKHIPGARLIPLGDLPGRLRELDPAKPAIVY